MIKNAIIAIFTLFALGLPIGCGTTTTFPNWLNTTYIPISKLGCAAQDVNLNTGLTSAGGTATDDGPCINAALSSATAQHPADGCIESELPRSTLTGTEVPFHMEL
jgi:hypothetical protein